MATEEAGLLPVHALLAELQAWQQDSSESQRDSVRRTLERIVSAYGAHGAYLVATIPPGPPIEVGAGSLSAATTPPDDDRLVLRELNLGDGHTSHGTLLIDTPDGFVDRLTEAVELSLTAVSSQQQAALQRRQLEALDVAVRGIASIGSVERVLQLIVDRVRDLAGAQYAALGIVGHYGRIDQFITSGISDELRALLGPPPRGHGLLGLIISEDRSLMIDDIATDPRRYGFPEHHPDMHSLLGAPVRSKGRTIGNLYLTNKLTGPTFNDEDLQLVEKFALHAAIAIENARLHEEIGRLAIVEERQRISQDLHDSIIQSLYAISLSLEDLPEVITEDPAEGAERADHAIDSIHATIRDIRNFIMGLQPELLDDSDLPSGIRTLGAEFEGNTLIDLELHLDALPPDVAQESAAHVLAITREALSNIARHSGATRASVDLTSVDGTMRLIIGDNGRGFDVAQARSAAQHGLSNLRSRAEAIGGTLTMSSELGVGTRLELTIPLETSRAAGDRSARDQEAR